ncbi:MAG: LacI family DNA-binding transcriptional regulator [Angelakisella sp.]
MVTIKQIAEACGVSVASVSKALNHATDISVETAERIRVTAHEMGYFPNAAARLLKTSRSNNIGVLFVDGTSSGLTHEYFSSILNSFKEEAEQSGYDITFISRNMGGRKMSYLEHCRSRGCDGVMIASVDFSNPSVAELVASNIPVVTIDYLFDNCGAILSDNVQSMNDLVRYIYGKGHRRIAFVHGEDTAVTRNRLASFYKTSRDLGLDIPDEHVIKGAYHDPRASGLATRQLLDLSKRPTCILYPDDFSYIGGMNEIERQGLSIPDDISVVGYDGIYLGRVLRPKLTTLRQDSDAIGIQAARLLVEAIESPRTYIPKRVVIPGMVWEGDTVKQL